MSATGSILLVDDEEKILKTLGRALRDEGHRVVERGDAREARSLIGEGGENHGRVGGHRAKVLIG